MLYRSFLFRKIKKVVVNIIVLPIRHRDTRHKIKDFLLNFRIANIIQLLKFKSKPVRENSVLLAEFNVYHGEVISGFLKYFQKLGFKVDVLVNSAIDTEKPFSRQDMSEVNLFVADSCGLKWIFGSEKILKYKHVFLTSSSNLIRWVNGRPLSALCEFQKLKTIRSLFAVEHEMKNIPYLHEDELLKNNRLITLGHFGKGVFVVPTLFGDIKKNPKNKLTTFITIGAIQPHVRNHNLLIQAMEKLIQEGINFKIIVIGQGKLDKIPHLIRPYIQVMGRVDFPKMFACLEKSDFLLPLLDPDNPAHNRYITSGVTGSAQLIYAFSKVPILHPKFAAFYQLNNKNSIIAKNLYDGMKQAILMSDDAYQQKADLLTHLNDKLVMESYQNLEKILFNGVKK